MRAINVIFTPLTSTRQKCLSSAENKRFFLAGETKKGVFREYMPFSGLRIAG